MFYHLSVFQKVKPLPMSYDGLARMLTHPSRHYMFGLRGDFSDMALREAYAGTFFTFFICPHRNRIQILMSPYYKRAP